MRSRIIAVSYLNIIRTVEGIEHADVALHADLILSPPRNCAASLRNGEADIALIPVAAIPTIPDIRIITPYRCQQLGPYGGAGLQYADLPDRYDLSRQPFADFGRFGPCFVLPLVACLTGMESDGGFFGVGRSAGSNGLSDDRR